MTPETVDVRMKKRLDLVGIDVADQYESLIRQMDKIGVDVVGCMEPVREQWERTIKKHPNRLFGIPYVPIGPNGADLEKMEYAIKSLGYKALKFFTCQVRGAFMCNNFELMDPVYKKAIDLDVPTMWHIGSMGFGPARMIHNDPGALNEVVVKYPQLKVVVCHLGEAQPWGQEQAYIEIAMNNDNVYIEASAVPTYWMMRWMPPMNPQGPPEMDKQLPLMRNWSMMNSDKIGGGWGKPYTHKDPRMMEAWRKVKEKFVETIRSCAIQCPNKFMWATDGPFAEREDVSISIYKEALCDDQELLHKVLGETAKKLFKL
jgi:predicted TIM-barrel fold metal-dependent hydrolase